VFMVAQTNTAMEHVNEAWQLLLEKSTELYDTDKKFQVKADITQWITGLFESWSGENNANPYSLA